MSNDDRYGDLERASFDIMWQLAEKITEMGREIAALKDELHRATAKQRKEEDMKTIL